MRPVRLACLAVCLAFALTAEPSKEDLGAVVRRALEAQTAGDLDALFAEADLSRASETSLALSRAVFSRAMGAAAISGLSVEDRSAFSGDKGNHALWRGILRYTLLTGDGPKPRSLGVIAHLTFDRENTRWRLANLYPDELLNLEIHQLRKREEGLLKGTPPRQADAVDFAQINQIIDGAAHNRYFNERKLALNLAVQGIGSVPILGDGFAMTYELLNLVGDASEAVAELKQRGLGVIAAHKVAQTAVGAFQVAVEVIPWVDRGADAVGLALEHSTYNLELQRAMLELKNRLLSLNGTEGFAYKPRIYALSRKSGLVHPDGVDLFTEDGSIAAPGTDALRPFGAPVRRINIARAGAFSQWFGLQVLGEAAVTMQDEAWQFMEKFSELGGVRVGDNYVLPIDTGRMIAEIQLEGDSIVEDPQILIADASTPVLFYATCRRGRQSLRIRLVGGEWTDPVEIWAMLTNRITGFELVAPAAGISRLNAGQTVSGLRILGVGPGLKAGDPQNPQPDLTPFPACLDIAVSKPDVVELTRANTFSLKALSGGAAELQILLIGSAAAPEYSEVAASFPIEVTALTNSLSAKADINFYSKRWLITVEFELRTSGPGFTVLSQRQMTGFGTETFYLDLQGPAAGADAASDAYELRAKVTNIRPLKGQTLEPGYSWLPYFNFIDNTLVKGPEVTFRFNATRGKRFNTGLGMNIHLVDQSGAALPGDWDRLVDVTVR